MAIGNGHSGGVDVSINTGTVGRMFQSNIFGENELRAAVCKRFEELGQRY